MSTLTVPLSEDKGGGHLKFRHELKYLINEGDAELIRERLSPLLQADPHAQQGSYSIRSLYFDDIFNTAYIDKINGAPQRKKYRVRVYNLDDSFIRLECKLKDLSYVSKLSAPLTREELARILYGDYGFLLQSPDPLKQQLYYECISRILRPKVYVDYEREPYVLDSGDVRITFDRNVRGAYPSQPMFSDEMTFHYVLEPGKLVMEVKYTEFLPRIVKQLLPAQAAEMAAFSKYTLCCDTINYMSAITSIV